MRKLLVKIIQLLDGTPAVYGKRQSGQSVVELALITPILIILLAGLVEIGWFANNYLNLLDVTRAGARRGAVLQDQKSPLFWDNKCSYVPNALLPADYQMPMTITLPMARRHDTDHDADRFDYRWYPDSCRYRQSRGRNPVITAYVDRVFYNEMICTMITSMEPLVAEPGERHRRHHGLRLFASDGRSDREDPDVAAQRIRFARSTATCRRWSSLGATRPTPTNATCSMGRMACFQWLRVLAMDRDPFDFNGNTSAMLRRRRRSPWSSGTDDFTELAGYDAA